LPKNNPNVGTGLVGAPACGDVMKLQIMVDEETGVISDVKFKTFGCGSAIASSSLATEKIKGKKIWEAKSIKNTDIAKELSLPPVKLHCSSMYLYFNYSACGRCYQESGGGLGRKKSCKRIVPFVRQFNQINSL
jgi:NifU-like protein involved in Fe-S cluster formation